MMQNATNFADFNWWSFALSHYVLHPFIMILVCLLSVFVVLGNLLVVSAIWHEHQMHSVTNYLIASLAAADCLVGAVVMPFSIISEIIIGTWTFGEIWCDLWHSFDVLASTASIMNLCAISLDRYLAITDPISYPARMTPKRVALLIVSLWTCSALISFPAILWWRAVGQGPLQQLPTTISPLNMTLSKMTDGTDESRELETTTTFRIGEPLYKCVFTDDPYYLLFSSFISFYGPLCVMLYAYYRIYKAAVQQTRFLKHGSKEVVVGKRKRRFRHFSEQSKDEKSKMAEVTGVEGASTMENYDRQHLVLRAHRGGGGVGSGSGIMRKLSNADCQSNHGGSKKLSSNTDQKINQYCESELLPQSDQASDEFMKTKDSRNAQSSYDLNQSNLSYDSTHKSFINTSSYSAQMQASIRRNRINLTSSKRDKLRVDSQRFDLSPTGDILMSNSNESDSTSAQEVGKIKLPSAPAANDLTTSDSGLDERLNKEKYPEATIAAKTKKRTLNQLKQQTTKAKPLVSFINNRSTSIDVSTIDHFNPVQSSNTQQSPSSQVRSQSHLNRPHHQRHHHHIHIHRHQKLKPTRGSSQNSLRDSNSTRVSDKINKTDGYDPDHDEDSIDNLLESDSTSTDSYGTGSIASVIVKPQPSLTNYEASKDKRNHNNSSCDTNEDSIGQHVKGRRALSFSEAHSCNSNKRIIREGSDKSSTSNHRASYCDPSALNADSNTLFKNSKTLNIRSWVKSTCSRQGKQQKGVMKPPPSLVPLMKMNSDTSTDSSNIPSAYNMRHPKDIKSSINEVDSDAEEKPNNMSTTVTISAEDNEQQFICFKNDKLGQKLVDLDAIHYIDCTSNSAKPTLKVLKKESTVDESNQNSEQTQHTVNIPISRQHRSVGKKLSKLAKERKAAKTLGIVVGVFILCWLPFFVVNIVVAFCGANCVYQLQLFVPVVTWLGWLNSAMNPVIYACWSRDFRRAFRRVLCSWVEFVCPYDSSVIARKLKLKKSSHYSAQDSSHRNVSSIKTSSATTRSAMSMGGHPQNGGVSRSHLILASLALCSVRWEWM